MTVPSTPRSTASKHRRHPIRTKTLVLLAVIGCLLLLIGRGTAQIVGRYTCSRTQVVLNVAVSPDIAPAITRVADYFNRRQLRADGHCVSVSVDTENPAVAAGQVDGQRPRPHPGIDAWIPDSSLWVDQARSMPLGANLIQPAGYSVALSPLMIVMPEAAAARVPAFDHASWRLLLPSSDGGPVLPAQARVELPDPSQNAAGLASLVEIGRMLGRSTAGRVRFSRFVYSTEVTSYFDDPNSLRYFDSLAASADPITVTTEQAVLAYDEAYPHQPLAARYPAGGSPKYGSPELDYPYVVTTASPARRAAAALFGRVLTKPYAQSVIRYAGFRSGRGVPDVFTASSGLSSQPLQVATPATPSEPSAALSVWDKLALSSRDLTLVDISSAMAKPASAADPTGLTFEQELTQTASLGLALFPDTANIGLWEFSDNLDHGLPYKPLVPIGPLSQGLGVISRRSELQRVSTALTPDGGPHAALYGSILDAYKYMQKNYKPKFFNTVIVLASGIDNTPGDLTAQQLLGKLTKLSTSSRKVAVIIIAFSPADDFRMLKKIALITGGQAYQIRNPARVAQVFYQALAHRLCGHGCVGP